MATAPADTAALRLEDEEVAHGTISGEAPDVTVNGAGEQSASNDGEDPTEDDSSTIAARPPPTEEQEPDLQFPDLEKSRTQRSGMSGGKPYSSFSRGRKWFIVILMTLAAVYS